MTMKKTFKKLIILILLLGLPFLSGCFKNEVVPNQNKVSLFLNTEYTQYMPYASVPQFDFTFTGTFYTIANVQESFYTVFASNDDVLLSQEIAALLADHEGRVDYEIIATENQTHTKINTKDSNGKIIPQEFAVDDGTVVDEVAYLNLENGLKLTINYRRFISQEVTYYVWRYTSSITMYLYYPFMVHSSNQEKKLLLLTLPNKIKFQVGPQLKVENMMEKDTYLDPNMYSFSYDSSLETVEEKQEQVRNYYIDYHNGYEKNTQFYFTYLGVLYEIDFYNTVFQIRFSKFVSEE